VTGQGTPRTASVNGEVLELARLHVIDGRRIVANQRQIIDRLKRDGRDLRMRSGRWSFSSNH
jgi:hypothetical protein